MIYVPLSVAIVGLLSTLFCRSQIAPQLGVATALVMAVLVPSNSPSRDVLTISVVGVIAVLLMSLFRNFGVATRTKTNPFLVLFILLSSLVSVFESKGSYGIYVVLTCVMYLILIVVASFITANDSTVLRRFVPIIVVFGFAWSFGEEFMHVKALWPLTNGTDNITSRINPVVPWLAGRAMGSASHPIPFGILAGICFVWCLWFAYAEKKIFYWVIACMAGATVLFSGTRSAILAVLIVLGFWFLASAGAKRLPVFVLALVGGLAILSFVDLQDVPGLAGFYSSESYTHRSDVIDFLPQLLNRPVSEFFFGSGYSSISSLLQSSMFAGGSGILVFDQEVVRTFTATGLIGIILLISALVSGYRRGNLPSRFVLVFLVVNFFSFDVLSWNLLVVVLILAASGPLFEKMTAQPMEYALARRSFRGSEMLQVKMDANPGRWI